ncbi:hypothetical protein ACHAC9_21890 [Massilia sp. CMS3.1]|uniref:hypothetical protein n=1 Tax=Massilia sp. CMS3.1 TaxID=3373083 RepID=UPI003EE7AE9C
MLLKSTVIISVRMPLELAVGLAEQLSKCRLQQIVHWVDGGKMSRTYKIRPRPANLGTGWNLKLIENGQEAGGGIFPVVEEDAAVGMAWWNELTEERRAHWLMMAASAMPAAARHAYLLAQAYNDALDQAEAWIGCKSCSNGAELDHLSSLTVLARYSSLAGQGYSELSSLC